MLGRLLYRLARVRVIHVPVRLVFARASGLLPVRRVVDTPSAVAFHHPRPSEPTHVLVVPKRAVPTLLDLADLDVITDVVRCGCTAAARLGLGDADCALVVNGGRYQDVGQLHLHLIAGGAGPDLPPSDGVGAVRLPVGGPCTVFAHPHPSRTTHFVVRAPEPLVHDGEPCAEALRAAYAAAQAVVRTQGLSARGFSVALAGRGLTADCLHVVSGGHVARPRTAD